MSEEKNILEETASTVAEKVRKTRRNYHKKENYKQEEGTKTKRNYKTRTPKINTLSDITYKTAFIIGLFQVLSIIPGTSRSGSTIIGSLLIGVSRVAAAEFTFFLAVPVMFGLSFIKLLKFGLLFTVSELSILLVGMAVAFFVSLLVIKFLMGYIKKHDFQIFGWYRIILGAVVLVYFLFR